MQDLRQLHKQALPIYPLRSPVYVFSPRTHEDCRDVQFSDLIEIYLISAAPERGLPGVSGEVHVSAGATVAEVGDSREVVDLFHRASGGLRCPFDLSELPASAALAGTDTSYSFFRSLKFSHVGGMHTSPSKTSANSADSSVFSNMRPRTPRSFPIFYATFSRLSILPMVLRFPHHPPAIPLFKLRLQLIHRKCSGFSFP